MTAPSGPVAVDTLTECPRCGGCCFRVMCRPWDGGLYLMPHGPGSRCHGPESADLLDLLLTQYGLRDDGGVSVR